jgi:hypothetical protein
MARGRAEQGTREKHPAVSPGACREGASSGAGDFEEVLDDLFVTRAPFAGCLAPDGLSPIKIYCQK